MRRILLTTALALPLAAGFGWAQDMSEPGASDQPATAPAPTDPTTAPGTEAPAAGDLGAPGDAGGADLGTGVDPDATGDSIAPAETDGAPSTAPAGDDGTAADAGATEADVGMQRDQSGDEWRGHWITDNSVTAPDGTKIGDVKDLILEKDGQISAVVVGVGGFLGMGAKDIAIDWQDLSITNDARTITTNLTKQEAESAPEYVFRDQEPAPSAME